LHCILTFSLFLKSSSPVLVAGLFLKFNLLVFLFPDFAVPGSPLDPRSEGTNGLLKQGATPVTEAGDVIAAVKPILGRSFNLPSAQEPSQEPLGPANAEPGADERSRLIALLGPAPVSIDDLVRLSHTSATNARSVLPELEIAGRLARHGAGLVSLL
jgi:DNA processing protein